MKQWSKDEVAIAHKYNEVCKTSHLDSFINFANSYSKPNQFVSILDLGCGNGRVLISINQHIKNQCYYVGVDLNIKALDAARLYFSRVINEYNNKDKYEFVYYDVDKTPWEFAIGKSFDYCLIDSTLHMFYEPEKVLYECDKYCDRIFITRNKIEGDFTKTYHQWGGMSEPSVYWRFSKEFFENFGSKTNRNIIYEIGPTPETWNIILSKRTLSE